MNKYFASTPLLITSILALNTLSAHADLVPLVGSDWSKENPGVLPYEHCRIEAWSSDIWTEGLGGAFLYGGHQFYEEAPTRLFCWTDELGLAFEIPLNLRKYRHAGLYIDLSMLKWNDHMTLKGLNGKKVENLFGRFAGLEAGIGVVVGGGAEFLMNKKRISIGNIHGDFKLGINLGYVSLRIEERLTLDPVECKDPLMLANGDLAIDSVACVQNGGVTVDFSKISNYRFKRIKKQK